MDSKQLKDFLIRRGYLDLLRDFKMYCSSPTSPDQPNPTSDSEMEVDSNPPNRKPTKRPSESREERFTQVTKRKLHQPRLYTTYGPGFIQLSGKKPKASTSASPVTSLPVSSRRARDVRRQRDLLFKSLAHRREVSLTSRRCARVPKVPKTLLRFNTVRHYHLKCPQYIKGPKLQPTAIPDFRNLSALLATLKVAYHTYSLKEEREVRVVLRGVPKKLSIEKVEEVLIIQDLPVQSVLRITNRTRELLDLVLVTANTAFIDNTTKLMFYNFKTRARCVKCLDDHGTTACTRKKDTDGPPAWVLRKSVGHTANYLSCSRAPKRKPTLNNNKKAPPPVQTAPHRAPARAGTENLSYAKAMAGPHKDPPTNSAPITSPSEDIGALISMISIIDIGEIVLLANEFKTAANPTKRFPY
ncbi:hypothetical protein EVAR_91413_1 [Eumeta japonica]|uniref:Pre-C2HC domain-containing protein n=1 Tax=Eumeta variegata TaxID=151549 RepID=A0A4C1XDN3_EUMVA|nr:hypothetical protein EVAR_91413_1 [Eumeta japonica]